MFLRAAFGCRSVHIAHSQSVCARSEAAGMLNAYRCTSNLTEFMKTHSLLNSMSPFRGVASETLGCLQQAFGFGNEFPYPLLFENVKVLLHRRAVGEVLFANHNDYLQIRYTRDHAGLIRETGSSTKRDLHDIIEDCLDRVASRTPRLNWVERLFGNPQKVSVDTLAARRFHDEVHAGVLIWMGSRAAEVQDECIKTAVESRIAELQRVHEGELTLLSDRETEHMRQLTNGMFHDKGRVLAEKAREAMGLLSRSKTPLPALEIKKMSVNNYFLLGIRIVFVVDATEEIFIPQGSMCTISAILPESHFPSEGAIDAPSMAVDIAPQIRQQYLDPNERLLLAHPVVESGGGRRLIMVMADAKKRVSTVHVTGPADTQLCQRTVRKTLHKSLSLAAFDDMSRLLVLYSAEDDRMQVNRFDDANYSQIKTMWEIPLSHDLGAPLRAVSIVPGKGREILMVFEGRIYLYSAMNKMWRSSQLHLKSSSQEQQVVDSLE